MRLREQIFSQWLWRLPPGQGQVALTFDDGPDPQSTPQLLLALRNYEIPSTMFLTGARCRENPGLTAECVAAGHAVGVHGFTHESFAWHSRNWQRASIDHTATVLSDQGISFHRLFRPPFGQFNPLTSGVLRGLGFQGVLWSQLTRDWRDQPLARLQRSLISHVHDGNIIVFHDHPRTINSVIACLPLLASEVQRRGWHFRVLPHPHPFETNTW